MRCDFVLVVLKGLIERGDGTVYFGSTLNYEMWLAAAVERGYVTKGHKPSKLGRQVYGKMKLDSLPKQGRAYMWDWSGIS